MPLFSLFCAVLPLLSGPQVLRLPRESRQGPRNGSPAPPNKTRNTTGPAATMGSGAPSPALSSGERKPTRIEGTQQAKEPEQQGKEEKRKEAKQSQRQAHKPTKRGYPPLLQGAGSRSPHHKFAPKNQQKVALGRFEKIFGKIFRGNVSGERKTPCVVSTEGGCLTNENREISNLAMQITKNAQKHYLITEGKGR